MPAEQTTKTPGSESARMTLGQHLDELRRHLVFALLGLTPLVAAAFYFGKPLLAFILAPAQAALESYDQPEMVSIAPMEGFSAYMRVSVIAALVVGSPWIFYQIWRFVSPGLHRHEKRFVYFLVPLSGLLTASGVIFLFKVILPLILMFLVAFGTTLGVKEVKTAPVPDGIVLPTISILDKDPETPQPGQMWVNKSLHKMRVCIITDKGEPSVLSIDMYKEGGIRQQYRISEVLSMILTLILAFACAFQAPLIVLLLGWAGLVDRKFLAKYRRHAAFGSAVIAAAVMPGDPASMMAMAIPLYVLYELGSILLWLFPAKRVSGKRETTEQEDDRP